MVNEKLIAGAVMILLNLVVLAPIATSMVEDAVEDNFETWPYDEACADSDCTTAEADWASSTSDRSYYAWNLTNADEVMAGEAIQSTKSWVHSIMKSQQLETSSHSTRMQVRSPTMNPSHSHAQWTIQSVRPPITQLNIPYQPRCWCDKDWLLKESWIH